MLTLIRSYCISFVVVLVCCNSWVKAQQPPRANVGKSTTANQIVVFQKRPTQVNDEIHQKVQCDLDAERTIRQQNQLVDTTKQTLERMQDRTLKILALEGGRPTEARLDYRTSVTNVRDAQKRSVEATQPVAGHVYFVQRQGKELTITDESGKPITEEEDKILREQLQNFGKPNPLAQFLNGKRVQVGQTIEVPKEVAVELLGMTGNSAKTDALGLTLVAARNIDGQPCAIFETILKTNGRESVSLVMKGELIVEANTCRTRSIRMHGPVAISETKGPAIGRFTVSTNGTLKVAVTTRFEGDGVAGVGVATKRKLFR